MQANSKLPIYIDGILFEPTPRFFYRSRVVFQVSTRTAVLHLPGNVLDPDGQADHQMRYYDASGKQLGIARQYPQTFYKDSERTTCRLVQMARSINCFPTRTIQCRSFAWDRTHSYPL